MKYTILLLVAALLVSCQKEVTPPNVIIFFSAVYSAENMVQAPRKHPRKPKQHA